MTELVKLSAELGGILPRSLLAALNVHTPVNLMAWGPNPATQSAVAVVGFSLASLRRLCMRPTGASMLGMVRIWPV